MSISEEVLDEIAEAFDEEEARTPHAPVRFVSVPETEEQRLKKKKILATRAEQAQRRASKHLNKAIDTLARLMDSPNEMVAKSSALGILEHAIGKPGQRKPQENEDDELLVMGHLPTMPE